MLDPYFILSAIVFFVPIYVCYRLYRSYQVANLRQKLYELRDSVFDDAHFENKIRPEDPAYEVVRTRINGLIRFAHRFYFTDLILFMLNKDARDASKTVQDEYESVIQNSRDREYYQTILLRMNVLVLMHLIRVAPLNVMALLGLSAVRLVWEIPKFLIAEWLKQPGGSAAYVRLIATATRKRSFGEFTNQTVNEALVSF